MPQSSRYFPLVFFTLAALPAATEAASRVDLGVGECTLFMLPIALMGGLAWALLMLLAIAVALALCLAAGALVFLGTVTSSVAIAIFSRSVSAGFRVLFLVLGAVTGVPAGIAAALLLSWLEGQPSNLATGAFVGLLLASMFNFAWGRVVDWLLRRATHLPAQTPA